MRRFAVVMFVLLFLAALPRQSAAQEATPETGVDIPAPAECTVAPRGFEELHALSATPPPATAEPASPPPFVMPQGEPVDDATAEAVRATIRELVACINAGDYWRLLALYSDRFVQSFFSLGGVLTQEAYDGRSTPVALPDEQQIAIVEFGEILKIADGRVAAIVIGNDPVDNEPAGPTIFYLVKTGDQWQIDEFEDVPE